MGGEKRGEGGRGRAEGKGEERGRNRRKLAHTGREKLLQM